MEGVSRDGRDLALPEIPTWQHSIIEWGRMKSKNGLSRSIDIVSQPTGAERQRAARSLGPGGCQLVGILKMKVKEIGCPMVSDGTVQSSILSLLYLPHTHTILYLNN